MKHRSKKLLDRFNATILQRARPGQLASRFSGNIVAALLAQSSRHLDVESDDRKVGETD